MKKKWMKSAICLCLVGAMTASSCYAETPDTVTIGQDGDYIMRSDGRDGSVEGDSDSTDETTSRTSTSANYTTLQRNALNKKEALRRAMKDIMLDIKNDPNSDYNKHYFTTDDNRLVDIAAKKYNAKDLSDEMNKILDYEKALDDAERENHNNSWIDRNRTASTRIAPSTRGDFDNMTPEEKRGLLYRLFMEFFLNMVDLIHDRNMQHDVGTVNPTQGTIRYDSDRPRQEEISHFSNYRIPSTDGNNVRLDLYGGYPVIQDSSGYSQRYKGWVQQGKDKGWPTDENGYFAPSTSVEWSAVLNDEIYVGLITEYQIENVRKDVLTNINYTSDQRRWTIYLNNQRLSEPVITDNPYHELNFTAVYEQYGAGEYRVVAEQLATFTRATYVEYDTCTYLFDMKSGCMLWFDEQTISNGRGQGRYIDSETTTTPEWVATGDEFTVTVNDLGEISREGGTQREE